MVVAKHMKNRKDPISLVCLVWCTVETSQSKMADPVEAILS